MFVVAVSAAELAVLIFLDLPGSWIPLASGIVPILAFNWHATGAFTPFWEEKETPPSIHAGNTDLLCDFSNDDCAGIRASCSSGPAVSPAAQPKHCLIGCISDRGFHVERICEDTFSALCGREIGRTGSRRGDGIAGLWPIDGERALISGPEASRRRANFSPDRDGIGQIRGSQPFIFFLEPRILPTHKFGCPWGQFQESPARGPWPHPSAVC